MPARKRVVLEAPPVTLRSFRPNEIDRWREGYAGLPVSGRAPKVPSKAALRKVLLTSGRIVGGRIDLAIEVDGRLIGDVQARSSPAQMLPEGVFEVGIGIWDPADRSRGYGRAAVGLFTDWLFREAGAERVQAGTAETNVAMRRVFENLGFSFEGIMRSYGPLRGRAREDFALYAVTRRDRPRRSGLTRARTSPRRRRASAR